MEPGMFDKQSGIGIASKEDAWVIDRDRNRDTTNVLIAVILPPSVVLSNVKMKLPDHARFQPSASPYLISDWARRVGAVANITIQDCCYYSLPTV